MSEQFKVGEVCIGQNFVLSTDRNGMECTIVGPLQERRTKHVVTGEVTTAMRYKVQWTDGLIWSQEPFYLRKKRPPTSAKSIMREAINKAKQPVEVVA